MPMSLPAIGIYVSSWLVWFAFGPLGMLYNSFGEILFWTHTSIKSDHIIAQANVLFTWQVFWSILILMQVIKEFRLPKQERLVRRSRRLNDVAALIVATALLPLPHYMKESLKHHDYAPPMVVHELEFQPESGNWQVVLPPEEQNP
jgi:hypothetical protein